jgi:hypothetical protein
MTNLLDQSVLELLELSPKVRVQFERRFRAGFPQMNRPPTNQYDRPPKPVGLLHSLFKFFRRN